MNTKDNTHLFSLLHSRNCAHKHITEKTSAVPNPELSEIQIIGIVFSLCMGNKDKQKNFY